jgi:hypothetical protein
VRQRWTPNELYRFVVLVIGVELEREEDRIGLIGMEFLEREILAMNLKGGFESEKLGVFSVEKFWICKIFRLKKI